MFQELTSCLTVYDVVIIVFQIRHTRTWLPVQKILPLLPAMVINFFPLVYLPISQSVGWSVYLTVSQSVTQNHHHAQSSIHVSCKLVTSHQ